eukprot:2514127-Rhodomonas_salina.3
MEIFTSKRRLTSFSLRHATDRLSCTWWSPSLACVRARRCPVLTERRTASSWFRSGASAPPKYPQG